MRFVLVFVFVANAFAMHICDKIAGQNQSNIADILKIRQKHEDERQQSFNKMHNDLNKLAMKISSDALKKK